MLVMIQEQTLSGVMWNHGTPPRLRAFAEVSYTTSDGILVIQGAPNSDCPIYVDVQTHIEEGVIVIPEFNINSTLDSIDYPDIAVWNFYLYSQDEPRGYFAFSLFSFVKIPGTTPLSWADLLA
jgi:hypothetical protein